MGVRYSPEVAQIVLDRLAGGKSLLRVCKDADMPSPSGVMGWVQSDRDGFAARYAKAREIGYLLLADEILELSDDGTRDRKVMADGREVVDHEVVARSRLQVDSRKWMLAHMLPKIYGDKLDLKHSGAMEIKAVADDKIDGRIAELLGKAGIAGALGGKRAAGLSDEDPE